jgi:hypothetical protein
VSTSGEIWEVMAEEISERQYDRGLELRLTGGYVRYGTGDGEAALMAAEIDPDEGVSGDAALAFACKHYDVSPEDVCNSRVRRTAVLAARASIATRLASAGWKNVRIARLLCTNPSNVCTVLKGGRGYGKLVNSRISKDLAARRPRRRPRRHVWQPRVVRRNGSGLRPKIQAVHTLRRLRAAGEERLFPRVMRLYFSKLNIDDVYDAAFGVEPIPLTLTEAYAAEARGEGAIKFVGGVPMWIPSPPQQTSPVHAVEPALVTLAEWLPPPVR